jgi:hypothetical protein
MMNTGPSLERLKGNGNIYYSMSVSNLIPYGEALGKAIWNYFGLSDYFKVKVESTRHGKTEYSDVSELWQDALKGSINDDGELKLKKGGVVKLNDFSFTEWFPWLPGMYWTRHGMALSQRGYEERATNLRDQIFWDKRMLSPDGKTLTVLSGIGAVRMNILRPSDLGEPIKVLGATTPTQYGETNVSSGVIIIMTKNAYDEIKRIEEQGVTKATVEGIYAEVPPVLDDVFRSAVNVPRFCIYVGSQLDIRDIHGGDNVTTAGWTIYERQQENQQTGDYNLAFCNFNVVDVQWA